MSADSFHSRVEDKMRSKAVLDWRDFLNLIRTCLTNPKNPTIVLDLKPEDFISMPGNTKEFLTSNLQVCHSTADG